MAGSHANISDSHGPLKGPGRSAPTLLEDLILFDPRQTRHPGYHLLEDGARGFAEAQFIGQLLPGASCFHQFCIKRRQSVPPATDEKANPSTLWQVAAICQRCRIHLLLIVDYSIAWQDEPCPNWYNPLHFLVRSAWRQDAAYKDLRGEHGHEADEVHVYECSSKKCSAIVTVQLSPPVLSDEDVHVLVDPDLLDKRTNAAFELSKGNIDGMKYPTPIDVLVDLRAYIRNAWAPNGQAEIALHNRRFMVRFGPEGKACANVLEALGFQFKPGQSWLVPQPVPDDSIPLQEPQNMFLDNVEAELDALILSRPEEERHQAHEITNMTSAWREISRVLSCQNYERDPSSKTTKKSLLHRARPFTVLGIPDDASDDLVIWAFHRQIMLEHDNSRNVAKLMTALEDIQRLRQSEKLSSQVAIERSQGRYGEQTIAEAYRSLGLPPDNNISDEIILGNFHSRLSDAPAQEQEMREALAAIGDYRQSRTLIDYASNTVTTYEDALKFLEANDDTDDTFLVSMFASRISDNNANQEMAQKAIQLIANYRNSDALRSFISADYKWTAQQPTMDIGDAFSLLGVEDRTIEDEALWTVFEVRLMDDFSNQSKLETAIKTIAMDKNSAYLKSKLQIPIDEMPTQPSIPLTEPVGLDNIGNTCYLNSLLQSLFTIVAIRKIVLNFDDYKQQADSADMSKKRVGQRLVSVREVRSAQNFVTQLAQLFRQMITVPSRAVRPGQELARLTLETGTARRKSTIQGQRRPTTLGVIGDRPIYGPLPQPMPGTAADADANQPLQSPDVMEGQEQGLVLENDAIEQSKSESSQISQTDARDSNGGIEQTLKSQDVVDAESMDTDKIEKHEDKDVEMGTNAANNAIEEPATPSNGMQVEKGEEPTEKSAKQESDRSQTVSPEPLMKEETSRIKQNEQPIYKPPEGPPPVPPRPVPVATLEEYARQQDVIEVLTHAIFQLSCAVRPTGSDKRGEQQDEVHDTFYGEEQQLVLNGSASDREPVQFLVLHLQVDNEPKDLYAALDNHFDVENFGENEVYQAITRLPPVLCCAFGRAISDDKGGQKKVNHHVEIPNTIFMDRYMAASKESMLLARRSQTWQFKKELRRLKARIQLLEPEGTAPVDESINQALVAIQHLAEVGATEKIDGLTIDSETIRKMSELSHQVQDERMYLKNRTNILEQQVKDSFTDAAFRKQEYKLHAAFFHRGTVGSGHYWIYIFDHVNEIWRKYNDDNVTHVTNLKEIFGDPSDDRSNPNWSAFNPANPYFLIYVRNDQLHPNNGEDSVVETVRREPITPPTPPLAINVDYSMFTNDGAIDEGIDLRPLGSSTPDNVESQATHHEFAGQQSQMSYMPPNAPRMQGQEPSQNQEGFANIGSVMQERPQQHHQQDSWDQEQMRQAIQRSLNPQVGQNTGKKLGDWDDSQNMAKDPNSW